MDFSTEEIAVASRTARSSGAVGAKALVPDYVSKRWAGNSELYILDYGSGPKAAHTRLLRKNGLDCFAYDFSVTEEVVEADDDLVWAFTRNCSKKSTYGMWDVVFASNVLNVQTSQDMLIQTIRECYLLVDENGTFCANYPASPRYLPLLKDKDVHYILKGFFSEVEYVKHRSGKIFVCRHKVTL